MLNIQAKLTLSAILALGFIGCGGGGNTPKDAAVVFLEKKYNGDLTSSIEADQERTKEIIKRQGNKVKEKGGLKEIEILSEDTVGKDAIVGLRLHYNNGESEIQRATLRRNHNDTKWLISTME